MNENEAIPWVVVFKDGTLITVDATNKVDARAKATIEWKKKKNEQV